MIKQNVKYEKVIVLEFKTHTWFQLPNNKHLKTTYGEIWYRTKIKTLFVYTFLLICDILALIIEMPGRLGNVFPFLYFGKAS